MARRIAHEIKNPLTPIQLSAERLKRRYLKEIKSDPATFQTCTDTIIRQVGEIGRMVDEFSSFGRMPGPSITEQDLCELIRQTVFLQRNAAPGIDFDCDLPDGPVIQACDSRQFDRALLNLLQNATDSIEARIAAGGPESPAGVIRVRLTQGEGGRAIRVEDNGLGLPKGKRHRLTEPYVTTRPRGTGLGLAIVQKIMEDHGGRVLLEDGPDGGARVSLVFPAAEDTAMSSRRQPAKPRSTTSHDA